MIIAPNRSADSHSLRQSAPKTALRLMAGLVLGASMIAAGPAGANDALARTFHERTFIIAADSRCGLFGPAVQTALGAAALQTRGVMLRSGLEMGQVNAAANRARNQAARTACDNAELKTVATRVEHAFDRWGRAARLEFRARDKAWRVDRFSGSTANWRLMQESRVGTSPVRFGLVGQSPQQVQPMAVVSFKGRSRPYAARLVMRDDALLARPHDLQAGQAQMPPHSVRRIMFATRQSAADRALLPEGYRQGEAWVFPQEAMTRLSQLDPREPFWIEYLFRDDSIARVPFEAGDLAAAQAFLSLGAI